MTKRRCAAWAGVLGAMLVLASGAQAGPTAQVSALGDGRLKPDQPIPPQELTRFIDGVAADAMAVDHIAGVSVAVVQDGRVVALRGYGMARPGEAVDPSRDLFRIGSVSKTFTWTVLMKEVERGRVRLDTPVNDYLPTELKIPDEGFRRPIRVIDLMSHAPGFEDSELGHLLVDRPERVTPLADYLVRHRPHRVREPGQFASYSNYGAALAGLIVARLEGQDYETLIEREVLGPVGMTSASFREPYPRRAGLPAPMSKALAARLATGFVWSGSGYQPAPFDYITQAAPAGAGSATAADMARYMRLHLAGGVFDGARVYGDETARAFRTPILAVPGGVNGWAHGFMARPMPGGFASYGHGGATQTFFSNMALIPDLRLGVFVTTNTNTGRAFAERLPKLIVGRFYAQAGPPPIAAGDPALPKIADRYAGSYVSTRRAYSGLEAFANLLDGDDTVSVTRAGYLVTKVGGVGQAWVPAGAAGHFRAVDSDQQLVFKVDGQGRALSFPGARGTFTLERAGPALDPRLFRAVAAFALVAALLIWIAAAMRLGRDVAPTPWQARAGVLALGVSALWLGVFAAFGVWVSSRGPLEGDWPGPALRTASIAALFAAVGSLVLLGLTPICWRTPAGQGGWSWRRKVGHLLTASIFVLLATLIAVRGGLTPWA